MNSPAIPLPFDAAADPAELTPSPTPAPTASEARETSSVDGHVVLVPTEELATWMEEGRARGAAVVRVDGSRRAARASSLGDAIDDAIEDLLADGGAPDAGYRRERERPEMATRERMHARSMRLGDQLMRAHRSGARGLWLALTNVRQWTGADGALGPNDTETLRFWTTQAPTRGVTLRLDPSDSDLPVHARPIALSDALGWTTASDAASSDDLTPATDATAYATPTAPVTLALPTLAAPPAPTPSPAPVATATEATPPRTQGIPTASEDDQWRGWMLALYAARGPQSLPAFERLFTEAYVPLTRALAAGLEAPRAVQAADEFRRSFARMYSEACPTFALTGKRPRMVLDAWDHAGKLARQTGARATQLLLVDGMRWDVGQEAKGIALDALGARAQLADERILWSAVPTSTPRQLATLARGVEALRTDDTGDGEGEPVRGRTAEIVRRLKVGSRDLYKLDLVEARLGTIPLDEIADLTGRAIARHAMVLPPRTLLFVFGDHGFRIPPSQKPEHGGTSPEEVLVPSFALLTGELH